MSSKRKTQALGKSKTSDRPATPHAAFLPLLDPNFSWDRFEQFCHHFVSLLVGVESCHRYGKQGNNQRGIDLATTLSSGGEKTYQCRQYKSFTKADVTKTIRENHYKAKQHIILVGSIVGAAVRDEIKKHRKWRLWDAADIALMVRKLDKDAARILISSHFGSEWAEQFLGIRAAPSFVAPGLFYKHLLNSKLPFHHALRLVGRTRELNAMHAFVEDSNADVYVLSGIGGSGKSRLIVELATDFGNLHPDWAIRSITETASPAPDSIRELPLGSCLIVVDDAHRRDDITVLLSLAKYRSSPTKFLLVSRVHGIPRIQADIAWAHSSDRTIVAKPLARPTRDERLEIARRVLGSKYAQYANALATAADYPLVLVVGGFLLRSKAVNPSLLERQQEFQQVVLDRFADEATAAFEQGRIRDVARQILPLLSAIQPIRPEDSSLIDEIAKFLAFPSSEVALVIGKLEEAGVLVRTGGVARIAPDVLADYLLHRACVNSKGTPTGDADRLFLAFQSRSGVALLTNLAELDWRHVATSKENQTILGNVWGTIQKQFVSLSHLDRADLLGKIQNVAHLQPLPVLDLARYALRNPSQVPESELSMHLLGNYASHTRVLEKLPGVLRQVSHNIDYLPECAKLLWEIGRNDDRSTASHPEHAMRILVALAEYDVEKPLAYQECLVRLVQVWIQDEGFEKYTNSPIDVLDALLARTGISRRSTGRALTMTPFGIDKQQTQNIRTHAIAMLSELSTHHQPMVVMRVIESLSHLLAGVPAPMNLKLKPEFYAQWDEERLRTLEVFEKMATRAATEVIRLSIVRSLRPFTRQPRGMAGAEGKRDQVADRAKAIIDAIPMSDNAALLRELFQANPLDEMDDDGHSADNVQDRIDRAKLRFRERQSKILDRFLSRKLSPTDALADIELGFADIRRHGLELQAGPSSTD